jgi:FtsP/CotA-like multicopper oxidase with cupredoxin domain
MYRRLASPHRLIIGVLLIALGAAGAFAQAQVPLPGSAIPQFVDPLPDLDLIVAGPGQITLIMQEFAVPVPSTGTFLPGVAPLTWVWGYLQPGQAGRDSYIGPVIVVTRGSPTGVRSVENIGTTAGTNILAYRKSTDQTLHWADPRNGGENLGNPATLWQGFVWHCHIVDHEDNEMMRPTFVVPDPGVIRTYVQGVDY